MTSAQPLKTYSPLEILEQTFRIYRDNFLTCVMIVAGVSIPISIINFILVKSSGQKLLPVNPRDPSSLSGVDFSTICLSLLIYCVLSIIQFVMIAGPISYITSESLFGRKITLMEAFRAPQARFTTLGWGIAQFYLALGVFAVAIYMVGILCSPVLALLGALVYIYLAAYGLIVPVLMLENARPAFGVIRAWSMGKSRFWIVITLTLIVALISAIITWAAGIVVGLILAQPLSSASPLVGDAVDAAISIIANIFLLSLMPITMTLLYYDTRLRNEGLADALAATNNPNARPSDVASPLPQPRLTPNDYRNMVIVIVVTLLLAILAVTLLGPMIDQMMPGLAIQ